MGLAVRRGAFSTRSTRNTWAAPRLPQPARCEARLSAHALQLTFGLTNGTVVELGPTPPVPVTELSGGAPSTMLPVHAATFQPDAGRTFSRTVSRDAPRTTTVSRDSGCSRKTFSRRRITRSPPELFAMRPPRGAGHARDMHKHPVGLMTPAEQREMLVFTRARSALASHCARRPMTPPGRHSSRSCATRTACSAPKVPTAPNRWFIATLARRPATRPVPFPTSGTRRLLHTFPFRPRVSHLLPRCLSSPTVSPSSCVPRLHTPHIPLLTHPPYAPSDRSARSRKRRAPTTARRRENIGRKRDTQLSFPLLEHDSSICDMRGAADRIFPRGGEGSWPRRHQQFG